MMRHMLLAVLATALIGGAAFQVQAQERLQVVATTGMIADAAARIGGDLVDIHGLMGAGVDPHAYRQTRSDIVAMTRADLVLWHGLFLEAQMEDFFQTLQGRQPVVAVAEVVPESLLRGHDDYAEKFDPHVWMDTRIWALVVTGIRDALTEVRPDAAATFAANTETYLQDIARVGAYAKTVLAQVPEPARVLLTAHDAFGYFGTAYDFEVLGVQGISTGSEAGLHRISEVVDMLVSRRIGAVFVESSVSDRNMRALIEGAAAQGHNVSIGGELFSDAMGSPGTYEGTYIGMIDHNVTTIARALGADISAGGMDGKLTAGM